MSNDNKILLDLVCKIDYHSSVVMTDLSWLQQVGVLVNKAGIAKPGIIECEDAASAAAAGFSDASHLFNNGLTKVYVIQIDKTSQQATDDNDPFADIKTLAEEGAFKRGQFFTLYIPQSVASDEDLYNDSIADSGNKTIITYLGEGYYPGVIERTFKYIDGVGVDHYQFAKNFVGLKQWKCNMDYRDTVDDLPWYEVEAKRLSENEWTNGQYIQSSQGVNLNDYNKAYNCFNNGYSTIVTDGETQYGHRVWGCFVGKKAVIVPYIEKELFVKIQHQAFNFMQLYKPVYSVTNATRLQNEIRDKVFVNYVPKYFTYVQLEVKTRSSTEVKEFADGFRVIGKLELPTIRALWGVDLDVYEYND